MSQAIVVWLLFFVNGNAIVTVPALPSREECVRLAGEMNRGYLASRSFECIQYMTIVGGWSGK